MKDDTTKVYLTGGNVTWVRLKTRSIHWGRRTVTGINAAGFRVRINSSSVIFSEEENIR